jgi:hypothetical protein
VTADLYAGFGTLLMNRPSEGGPSYNKPDGEVERRCPAGVGRLGNNGKEAGEDEVAGLEALKQQ